VSEMKPPYVHVALVTEAFCVEADVSLHPVQRWWDKLTANTMLSRMRDEAGAPLLTVRVACPECYAQAHRLTKVDRPEGVRRKCGSCGHEFPVGGEE